MNIRKNLLTAAILSAASFSAQAEVRTERVTFTSGGETLVGTLYIPDGVDAANPAAAAVVTGAWMTIKEQMPARYGRELAERGVVALTFDFRNWGESGGTQRALESPVLKTEDIRAAVAYLQSRDDVDEARLGGLGICASAGYMASAAATTPAPDTRRTGRIRRASMLSRHRLRTAHCCAVERDGIVAASHRRVAQNAIRRCARRNY